MALFILVALVFARTAWGADDVLGIGLLGSFFLLVALVLVWALVIAPRRAVRLFQELEGRGYAKMDRAAPELQSAIKSLAPIMLEGTVRFEEGSRQTLNALIRTSGFHPRYVVNIAQSDESGSDSITTWQTLVLEARPLPVEAEFSVRLRVLDSIGRGREERFGFRKVEVRGLSAEFSSLYAVYSSDGRDVAVSSALQQALLDVSRTFWPSSNSNTRFGPGGWGISASSAWLDRKALRILLDAADRISGAL